MTPRRVDGSKTGEAFWPKNRHMVRNHHSTILHKAAVGMGEMHADYGNLPDKSPEWHPIRQKNQQEKLPGNAEAERLKKTARCPFHGTQKRRRHHANGHSRRSLNDPARAEGSGRVMETGAS